MQAAAVNQVHEKIEHLDFVERRVAMLTRRGGAGKRKNSRADDRPDTQRRE
jgi:hypothetical protein